ncbi:MAG TPA: TetR family transcriptional regulator [Gaiellales bacterium]|nr:TetR family transcriptional regulator [Gaiellales bacterium]
MVAARSSKGERTRQAILEAALRVVARGGVGDVTHRRVAAEAGVPLGATTYYFSSKDELLRETLRYGAQSEADFPATVAEDSAALAAALAGDLDSYLDDRPHALATYEVFLAAARDPLMADAAEAWTGASRRQLEPALESLGSADPELDARVVTALLDGLGLEQLAGQRDDFVSAVARPIIERLLTALLPHPTLETTR